MDSTAVIVQPGDFATTFVYSEFYILGVVIPNLVKLANDPEADSVDVARYLESISRWEDIVTFNQLQKENARFMQNVSFDAGVEYAYSATSDTTTSETLTGLYNTEFKLATGFEVSASGVGLAGSLAFITNTSNGGKNEQGTAKGITIGYVLKDDDPLDAFTIDVGMDSVYKTPVFNLKAGQSSCPWEPGTANREGPNLQASQFVAVNVPANEPAVFQLTLGNVSATNEDWTYGFTSVAANNPDGAVIKLNGQPLNYIQEYIVPYGTSQMVTLTVERGPIAYDYDSLLVAEISVCEYERNLALSIPVASDPNFFSGIYLGAHFIRPCSEVNINVPQQDWVVFPDPLTDTIVDDNVLRITVSGYNLNEPEFKLIRLQYRPSNGDGAWINLPDTFELFNPNWVDFDTLPGTPPELGPVFSQFYWQTAGLKDGAYEIRALAVCTGDASDKPGYSQIIKGRIDREPPSLVGVPQPSDGVLQVGDEISFTFNQPVNCDDLIQADLMNPNNVGLYDATTNTLIDAHVTCVGNKIVIDPLFQNQFFENRILRAELHDIEDLTGNKLIATDWEFYVDRNELAWLKDSVGITKYEDESRSITAKIHNRGGYPVPFSIEDVPAWVHVTPDAGTLVPNEILDIQFTLFPSLALGEYGDSIRLHTEIGGNPFFMGGDEYLKVGARNLCRPPQWDIDPGSYQLTMTMSLGIEINDTLSVDPEDQVAVFIDGQVRGTAKLTYVAAYDTWVAFVTVYGNTGDSGRPLVFEIFDASACLHYPATLTGNHTFVANAIVGSPNAPGIVSTDGILLREIPVKTGWNWISFNLAFPDGSVQQALSNIPSPLNDLIKDQSSFSTYYNSTWSGSLDTIRNTSLYLYQANQDNIIKMAGTPILPASLPLSVQPGWNWIGYVPNYPLPVNAALASIPATAGDIIKNQSSFAQYVDNVVGWVGSLETLEPPHGYLLKATSAGMLLYPPESFHGGDPPASRSAETQALSWTVDPLQFEFTMTTIAMLQAGDDNVTAADMELGAFVDGEVRGAARAIYIEWLDAYLFFLTSYANVAGEQVHFKILDPSTGDILDLKENMVFLPNDHQGSMANPVPFTLQVTGTNTLPNDGSFTVHPNPFRDETVCRIILPHAQAVFLGIYDLDGREVDRIKVDAQQGTNTIAWQGRSASGAPLANGVYLLRLKTEQGMSTKKVVLQR